MNLSKKTNRYLENLKRDKDWTISDRQVVIGYLSRQKIPLFDKIIEFEIDFSGFEFTISGKPGSTFKAMLFSKANIVSNTQIDIMQIKGQSYFFCGEHETAQFWFVISGNGQICTYNNEDETINIIFSSFDKLIETYALSDSLNQNKKYELQSYFKLIDENRFDLLTESYTQHEIANDDYNKWLFKNSLVIQKGTWFDRHDSFIHVYGDNKEQCDSFIQILKEKQIIV